jgi:hypothetical protein
MIDHRDHTGPIGPDLGPGPVSRVVDGAPANAENYAFWAREIDPERGSIILLSELPKVVPKPF